MFVNALVGGAVPQSLSTSIAERQNASRFHLTGRSNVSLNRYLDSAGQHQRHGGVAKILTRRISFNPFRTRFTARRLLNGVLLIGALLRFGCEWLWCGAKVDSFGVWLGKQKEYASLAARLPPWALTNKRFTEQEQPTNKSKKKGANAIRLCV